MLCRILLTDVKDVSHTEKKKGEIITIKMRTDDKPFIFYADSQQSTLKWYRYCRLLFKVPMHYIPEIPTKENVALQHAVISQYNDLHNCYDKCKYVYMHMCVCVCVCMYVCM